MPIRGGGDKGRGAGKAQKKRRVAYLEKKRRIIHVIRPRRRRQGSRGVARRFRPVSTSNA